MDFGLPGNLGGLAGQRITLHRKKFQFCIILNNIKYYEKSLELVNFINFADLPQGDDGVESPTLPIGEPWSWELGVDRQNAIAGTSGWDEISTTWFHLTPHPHPLLANPVYKWIFLIQWNSDCLGLLSNDKWILLSEVSNALGILSYVLRL